MKKIGKLFLLMSVVVGAFVIPFSLTSAQVNPLEGVKKVAGGSFEIGGDAETSIAGLVVKGLQVTVGLLGVVAVILFIYSGMMWMTAGGNTEKVAKAKKIIVQVIVGVIIVTLTYAIIAFVLGFFKPTS